MNYSLNAGRHTGPKRISAWPLRTPLKCNNVLQHGNRETRISTVRLQKRWMLLKNSSLIGIALQSEIRNVYPQSAIAHNASNRDIFPRRVVRARQAEFFNSIAGLGMAILALRAVCGAAPAHYS